MRAYSYLNIPFADIGIHLFCTSSFLSVLNGRRASLFSTNNRNRRTSHHTFQTPFAALSSSLRSYFSKIKIAVATDLQRGKVVCVRDTVHIHVKAKWHFLKRL
jgi:hypothetical protein